jgi:hypothetical protein
MLQWARHVWGRVIVNFASNLNMKDRESLLLYLGVALLCAACFALGLAVGRTTAPVTEAPSSTANPSSAMRSAQSSATPDR